MAAAFADLYRLGTSQTVAVASVGGAATSTAAFGTETYGIALSFPGSTSSTSGVRVKIISPADVAVSSTQDFLLRAGSRRSRFS